MFLLSQPKTSLRDFRIKPTLDDRYLDGIFELETTVSNYSHAVSYADINYKLLDNKDNIVATESKFIGVQNGGESSVQFSTQITEVATWSYGHLEMKQEMALTFSKLTDI